MRVSLLSKPHQNPPDVFATFKQIKNCLNLQQYFDTEHNHDCSVWLMKANKIKQNRMLKEKKNGAMYAINNGIPQQYVATKLNIAHMDFFFITL